ncbi:S46 family peptidase [Butyricimonas paravirosa]|uniref:S46 family peptidase n=1 Tax=Butyricimonas paravirosa TaxID=1472417 RepID=UPI0022E179E7|nr:S46 family peptidase [Butyricimonas paravirosa]
MLRDRFSKELKIIFLRDFADFVSINDKLLSCFCRANFTSTGSVADENVTFGAVRGCEMNELSYRYYTTMDGMYNKYLNNPSDSEYYLSKKMRDLYQKQDYGRYDDKDGRLRVCFLMDALLLVEIPVVL